MLQELGWAQERPFPENRVRAFYRQQAEAYLGKPTPSILAPFPGLDGGAWGHWGQNPESENTDRRLNEVDVGGMLMQVTRAGELTVPKGVSVRVGEYTVLFDPLKRRCVAAWRGDLVRWASSRYGITSGVTAAGPLLEGWSAVPSWPERALGEYEGLHRRGEEVVFAYRMGESRVFESARVIEGRLHRVLRVSGDLARPEGGPPTLWERVSEEALEAGLPPSASQWATQTVTTRGTLGRGPGPFVIDTLTVPYRDANPFKTPMRFGGVGVLPGGRLAVCTLMGDVWLVSGVDEGLESLTWRRYAAGLHQPLGLLVNHGDVYVIGRDQLTRLRDTDGDDEADIYECVTHAFPTAAGNNFALSLHQDNEGRFYWFTRSQRFGVTRWVEGQRPESMATGLRGTNGLGVSPDGRIVFALPQEGDWQPASGIFEVGEGSFHGHGGPRVDLGKHGYEMPMCFLPRGVDNSSGDMVFLPDDARLGPLSGRMLGTSFGYCQHYLVLREAVGERSQGGVVPLPGDFLSGAHRTAFNPHDGHLYVAGTDGWQSYARENGSLQRLRYVGGNWVLPERVETRSNGFLLTFSEALDPDSVRLERVFAQQWNYLYSSAYGSQEYSVKSPGVPGHDPVALRGVHLLPDQRSVFVEIPQLHPVMQFHLYLDLDSVSGSPVNADLYYSVFQLGEPFTDFEGGVNVPKEPWNDFPRADDPALDRRLLAQERLGKILGDEAQLAAVPKFQVDAVAGLKFEPERLTAKAGTRATLQVVNRDPSMPHNLVLVRPEALRAVGEGSMRLAATPDGAARHYVIEHEGVIAFSPLLQSGSQYTIYFDVPEAPGEYPFLCTFPGHWQVTRGVLTVVE